MDAGTVSIQRTIGMVRNKGEGAQIVEKVPKTKRSRRVIDIDPYRGCASGTPKRFWRAFKLAQRGCAKVLGDGAPPVIAIHDLRRIHATLLADREPVKTVSERLGHASITVTLAVYGHVMPGDQKCVADRFAALVGEA